ncbi:MAG: hypothetical protein J6K97_02625 [Clostridia bacterium]|nr:hypothetical protein [Clostridia bacterium]
MNRERYKKFLEQVREDGFLLSNVPYRYRTLKLCQEAVKTDGGALWFVPKKHQTNQTLILAINQDPTMIHEIPTKRLTKEFFLQFLNTVDVSSARLPRQYISSPEFQEAYTEYLETNNIKLYKTDEDCIEK